MIIILNEILFGGGCYGDDSGIVGVCLICYKYLRNGIYYGFVREVIVLFLMLLIF